MTHNYYDALIADILSFTSNTTTLSNKLQTAGVNWELFVYHSTAQLVLPAVYCRLKERGLLDLLPDDLVLYMAQFTSINRNRNKAILKQLKAITAMLNSTGIRYVYLKGAAMLAGGFYKDIGERMIGDIDLLVAEKDMIKVYNALKENGFAAHGGKQFLLRRMGKHLPKMCAPGHIASVEIHRWLFNQYRCPFLSEAEVLDNVRQLAYPIPAQRHLLLHNILNWQVNDRAYFNKSIGFRAIYDTLLIAGKGQTVAPPCRHRYIKAYTSIAARRFTEFEREFTCSAVIFDLKSQSRWFHQVFNKVNTSKRDLSLWFQQYLRWITLLLTSGYYRKKAKLKLWRKLKPKRGSEKMNY